MRTFAEPIVTIACDGTVTIHKEGGDKEAARLFYESLQFEGRTLLQKIKDLEAEIISLKVDPDVHYDNCTKHLEEASDDRDNKHS